MSTDQGTADTSPHYNQLGRQQPILQMLELLTRDEFLGFLKGNVIKYQARVGLKAGTDDKVKAAQYNHWTNTFERDGYIEIKGVRYYM